MPAMAKGNKKKVLQRMRIQAALGKELEVYAEGKAEGKEKGG